MTSPRKFLNKKKYNPSTPFDPIIQTYFKINGENDGTTTPDPSTPPSGTQGIRYAIGQLTSMAISSSTADSISEAINYNFSRMTSAVKLAAVYNTQLISFSELHLCGYEFGELTSESTQIEIDDVVSRVNGAAAYLLDNDYWEELGPISNLAKANNIAIVANGAYSGQDPAGNKGVYDAAVIFDSDGTKKGIYFKNNLWGYSERQWFKVPKYDNGVEINEPYPVFEINGVSVGIAICYDAEFPETARCLSLNGAKIMVMPTAAPETILSGQTQPYPDVREHYIPANALVNQNFCSYGNKAQFEYISDGSGDYTQVLEYSGNSIICSPYGEPLVQTLGPEEALLIADCVLCDFPSTQPPEADYLINRRPELYSTISSSTAPFPYGTSGYVYPDPYPDGKNPEPAQEGANSCS